MKKIIIFLLFVSFIFSDSAVFAENWVFTAPNNTNTYYNTTNVQSVESNGSYQAYSSDSSYYGSVTTNVIPNETQYTYNNTQTTNNSSKNTSFSERHPILAGIGFGALLLGVTAITALTYEDEDDKKRDRRPPPPPHDGHKPPHDYHNSKKI